MRDRLTNAGRHGGSNGGQVSNARSARRTEFERGADDADGDYRIGAD